MGIHRVKGDLTHSKTIMTNQVPPGCRNRDFHAKACRKTLNTFKIGQKLSIPSAPPWLSTRRLAFPGNQRAASKVMSRRAEGPGRKRNWDYSLEKDRQAGFYAIFRYQKSSQAVQAKSWQWLPRIE